MFVIAAPNITKVVPASAHPGEVGSFLAFCFPRSLDAPGSSVSVDCVFAPIRPSDRDSGGDVLWFQRHRHTGYPYILHCDWPLPRNQTELTPMRSCCWCSLQM